MSGNQYTSRVIVAVKQWTEFLLPNTTERPQIMHSYVTCSFSVLVWTVLTNSCGAWVSPLQNALIDRPATASESVHEALVKAEIIPNGKCLADASIMLAFSL